MNLLYENDLQKIENNKEMLELYNIKKTEIVIKYFSNLPKTEMDSYSLNLENKITNPVKDLEFTKRTMRELNMFKSMAKVFTMFDDDDESETLEGIVTKEVGEKLLETIHELNIFYENEVKEYSKIIDVVNELCDKIKLNYKYFFGKIENMNEIIRKVYKTKEEAEKIFENKFNFFNSGIEVLRISGEKINQSSIKKILSCKEFFQQRLDEIYGK